MRLDTTGDVPRVVGLASRSSGRRVTESEQPITEPDAIRVLTEDDVRRFVMKELEPFVEK